MWFVFQNEHEQVSLFCQKLLYALETVCSKTIKNHRVVPPGESDVFLSLTFRLIKTDNENTFIEVGRKMLQKFPDSRKWLQWWLQPSLCSTIFLCMSVMKEDLRKHSSRTTDAIEAYHSALYRLIPKRLPVISGLCLLSQVAKRNGDRLSMYFGSQVRPSYGSNSQRNKAKPKKTKALKPFYEQSDSCPPDNSAALFDDKPKGQINRKRNLEQINLEDNSYGINYNDQFKAKKPTKKKQKNNNFEVELSLEEEIDQVMNDEEELYKQFVLENRNDEIKNGPLDFQIEEEEESLELEEDLDERLKETIFEGM